ncbi:transmembrane protein, putative (macronuclear) [Tetrahymena thermophila SB210]|uniref:Transmembrane protein, putative n=1 Tax=Tetrahymena thermophila (strain SB210) TaxID=312017 RepID=Q22BB3_TETTS|nr:transmembrane protein, putative [Tetrahymena thermophila SB210]EAR82595.2 transmembrane protein, putative [Tetrahymena thermophila SB210]|eukprot:XP_001030258.2 transmembrane protein, putative [Tetrahymena thermophila SB210]
MQAMQSPIKTQIEIKKILQTQSKLSIRNISLINQIDEISANIIYGKKKSKKDEYQSAIQFDSRIQLLNQTSRKCYALKRDFFEFLCQSSIDIQQLFDKGYNLYQQMKNVEYEIFRLMAINSLSKRLNEVASLFMSVFDLRRKEMRKKNIISKRHLLNSYAHSSSVKQELSIDLFSTRNSCVINMSLLNKLGQIKECTKSVQYMFMIPQKELVGCNVNILMPSCIAEHHDSILLNYIQNENLRDVQNEKKYLFLGQDKLGQIIPLKTQMQLYVKPDDFCVVAFLCKVSSTNQYILFQRVQKQKSWQISNISKGLNSIFMPLFEQSQTSKSNLKNLCLEKMIPLITAFKEFNQKEETLENIWNKEQTTLLFHPKNQHQFNYLTKNKLKDQYYDSESFNKLVLALIGDNFGFVEIKFKIQQFYKEIHYIEISSIRYIKRQADKNESIIILANQLSLYNNSHKLEVNLNELRRIIDNIKQQQSLLDIPEGLNMQKISSQFMNPQGSLIKSEINLGNLIVDTYNDSLKTEDQNNQIYLDNEFKNSKNFNNTASKEMYIIEEDQQESHVNHKSSYIHNNFDPNYSFKRENNRVNHELDDIKQHEDQEENQENEYYNDQYDQQYLQLETTNRKNNITNRELLQQSETNREFKIQIQQQAKVQKQNQLDISLGGASQNGNNSFINQFDDNKDAQRQVKYEEVTIEHNKSMMDISSINLMKQHEDSHNQSQIKDFSHQDRNINLNQQKDVPSNFSKNDQVLKKNDLTSRSTTFNSQINLQGNNSSQNIEINQQVLKSSLNSKINSKSSYVDHSSQGKNKQFVKQNVDNNHLNEEDEDQQDERELTEKLQSEREASQKASSITNNFNINQGYENINAEALVDQSNSSKTRTELSSTKRRIAYIITNKKQNILIKSINYFGYVALILLSFITLFVYFTLQQNLDTMIQNLQQITTGTDLMYTSSFVLVNYEAIRSNNYGAYNHDFDGEFKQHFIDSYIQSTHDFRDKVQNLTVLPNKFQFVQYVNNNKINIKLTDADGSVSNTQEQNIIYAICNFYSYLVQYITIDSLQIRGYIFNNYLQYQDVYQTIRDITLSEAQSSNDSIQNILVWTFILIEVVSAINIFMILPIYYKVQCNREEILRLFVTFPKEKLQSMVNYMNKIVNSRFYKSHSSGGNLSSGRLSSNNGVFKENIFKSSHIKWKNKVISNTTTLKKFNSGIFGLCFVTLILISIYPTINYSVLHPYLDQFKIFFEEFLTLQKVKSQICFTYAIAVTRVTTGIEDQDQFNSLLDNYYKNNLLAQNEQILQDLNQIPKNFEKINRYHNDQQKQILLTPLESNLCEFMRDFQKTSLFSKDIADVPDEFQFCDDVFGGLLTKGMILAAKQTLNVLYDLITAASTDKAQQAIPHIQQWDQINPLPYFDRMDDIDLQFIDIISSYLMVQYNQLFDLFHLVQNLLLGYSLTILLSAFLFGWRYFIQYSNQQIVQTKIILSVLNIDHIVDNSYIFSYFKKQFGQSQ